MLCSDLYLFETENYLKKSPSDQLPNFCIASTDADVYIVDTTTGTVHPHVKNFKKMEKNELVISMDFLGGCS